MQAKRLRKKLYKGEFAVYGFSISGEVLTRDEQHEDVCLDELLNFIESLNLIFGGGLSDNKLEGFISSAARYGSATEQNKAQLVEWLSSKDWILNISIGELVDANYGV